MSLTWLAIAVMSLLLIAVGCYALLLSRRLLASEAAQHEQIKQLRHDFSAINNAAIGVGQRLIIAEKKLKGTIDKQQQLETNASDFSPYNHAVSLAESGADSAQLVERCGLSEAEAELLTLVQSGKALAAEVSSGPASLVRTQYANTPDGHHQRG